MSADDHENSDRDNGSDDLRVEDDDDDDSIDDDSDDDDDDDDDESDGFQYLGEDCSDDKT